MQPAEELGEPEQPQHLDGADTGEELLRLRRVEEEEGRLPRDHADDVDVEPRRREVPRRDCTRARDEPVALVEVRRAITNMP